MGFTMVRLFKPVLTFGMLEDVCEVLASNFGDR
jgi:hypothetical protein